MSSETFPPTPADDRAFRRVLVFFTLILVVLLGVAIASVSNLNRAIATSDWVNHTHALITELDSLQPTLAAAEGELSRFALTGEASAGESSQERFAQLSESTEVINALVASSSEEKQLFAPATAILTRRAEVATRVIQLKKSGETAAVQKILSSDTSLDDRRALAAAVGKLRDRESTLLSERDRASFRQAQTTRWTVIGGVVLEVLLLCGAAWLIRDDLRVRRRAAALLKNTNDQLEEKVGQRTAELSAANAELTAKNIEDRWAKQAIEHQNRYNLLIIDSIADAVFVVTKLVNVSRVNPAAVHLTGLAPTDLIDKPLGKVVALFDHDPAATMFDPLVRALADGHEMRQVAARVTLKNGQTRAVRLNLYPLRDRDKVVGGVVILQSNASAT